MLRQSLPAPRMERRAHRCSMRGFIARLEPWMSLARKESDAAGSAGEDNLSRRGNRNEFNEA